MFRGHLSCALGSQLADGSESTTQLGLHTRAVSRLAAPAASSCSLTEGAPSSWLCLYRRQRDHRSGAAGLASEHPQLCRGPSREGPLRLAAGPGGHSLLLEWHPVRPGRRQNHHPAEHALPGAQRCAALPMGWGTQCCRTPCLQSLCSLVCGQGSSLTGRALATPAQHVEARGHRGRC